MTDSNFLREEILFFPSRSKDEEIELVSEEDFYRDAPVTISRPVSDFTIMSTHSLGLSGSCVPT